MNIYPFNYWVLYVACIVLLIFVVLTIVKLKPLLKALNSMNAELATIQTSANELTNKIDQLPKPDPNKKQSPIGAKEITSLLLILRAILKDQKNSGNKGTKQFKDSANKVIHKRVMNQSLKDELIKILKRSR